MMIMIMKKLLGPSYSLAERHSPTPRPSPSHTGCVYDIYDLSLANHKFSHGRHWLCMTDIINNQPIMLWGREKLVDGERRTDAYLL